MWQKEVMLVVGRVKISAACTRPNTVLLPFRARISTIYPTYSMRTRSPIRTMTVKPTTASLSIFPPFRSRLWDTGRLESLSCDRPHRLPVTCPSAGFLLVSRGNADMSCPSHRQRLIILLGPSQQKVSQRQTRPPDCPCTPSNLTLLPWIIQWLP